MEITAEIFLRESLPWSERLLLAARRMAAAVMPGLAASQSELERRFESIISSCGRLIAGICLSFARSQDDFDDLRQDAMLNIWRGLPKFREESTLTTWIYRVTLNSCVSYQRKSSRKQEVSLQDLYSELYDNSSPEEVEMYATMYRLIGELAPIDRSVTMMWLDGKSYEEIAEVIGISRNGIASRLKRSKDRLAAMYDRLQDA